MDMKQIYGNNGLDEKIKNIHPLNQDAEDDAAFDEAVKFLQTIWRLTLHTMDNTNKKVNDTL